MSVLERLARLDPRYKLRNELEQLRSQLAVVAAGREDYLRQRDAALGERDELLRQRDGALAERDAYLRQRDEALGERNELLRQRDGALAERDAYLRQRDEALGERNELLRQRDGAHAERDAYLRQRDQVTGERDAYVRQRDQVTGERDAYVRQRDQALGERDAYLRQRDQVTGERDAYVRQRDQALGERDAYLRQRDQVTGERDAYLRQRDQALGERNDFQRQRDEALGERNELQRQRDEALGEKNELRRQCDGIIGEKNVLADRVARHVHRADTAVRHRAYGPAAAVPDRILVFLHLAKTGGVTLCDIIVRNLSIGDYLVIEMPPKDESVLWTWSPAEVERAIRGMSSGEAERIRAVLGHYRYGIHDHLPRPCACMTMLRDPIDRVASYFYYDVGRGVRKEPDGSIPSFEDYANRRRHYDLAIDNYMTRILSGLIELDPTAPDATTENTRSPTTMDFEVAVKNMESCFLVGLTDQFDETLLLLGTDLCWSLSDLVYAAQNATASRPAVADIPPSVREQLARWNQFDVALVERARAHLARRIAAYPGNFERDLSLFRQLNSLFQRGTPAAELRRIEREALADDAAIFRAPFGGLPFHRAAAR